MTKIKKLILSLSIAFTMCVVLVIGFVLNSSPNPSNALGGGGTIKSSDTEVSQEVVKPTTYTYLPGEVLFKRGGSTLSYNYTPSADMKDGAKTVAYEYCFGNSMNRATAVNLKEIDTTDVTVSYAWSLNTKLDTTQSITTYTNYELQRLNNYGDEVYIYVFVTPTNETIPTTFTSSVVWYYGIPYEMPIFNNVTNTVEYQTVVDGQKIDKNTLNVPEAPTGCYFDGWYLDKGFGTRVSDAEFEAGRKMYARFANLPSDWIMWEDDHYFVTKYRYDDTTAPTSTLPSHLVIPAIYNDGTHGEAPVTHIYNYGSPNSGVFYNQDGITKVTIPNTLTDIGWEAFHGCYYLTEVNFDANSSVRVIGDGAFASTSLTSVTIPASVTHILGSAFRDSASTITFEHNSQLTDIGGSHALQGVQLLDLSNCDNLTSITVADCIRANTLILPNTVTRLDPGIMQVLNLIFEDNSQMTTFNDQCNWGNSLKSIDFGNNSKLTSINQSYFNDNTDLTHIDFGDNSQLTTIEEGTFSLDELQSVNFGKNSKVTTFPSNIFNTCKNLKEVNLPSNLTTIGNYAFEDCSYLTEITIPASVKNINKGAFTGSGLKKVVFETGSQLQTIGVDAFYDCADLSNVNLQNCVNLQTISDYGFQKCPKLTTMTIPASVTSIGKKIFEKCTNLVSVNFAPNSQLYRIYDGAFDGCTALKNITIPASVNYIQGSAFINCTSLQNVTFETGSQLVQIYSNAFAHCENLQTVNLQACTKLNRIDSDTFHWCYKLQSITIPDSVTYMGSSIFRECRELTTVTIPENVANIGRYCFEGCTKLTEIVFQDDGKSAWFELLTKADWLEFTGGTYIDLSNPQYNVTILTEIAPDNTDASKYSNKYLYKTDVSQVTTIEASSYKGNTNLTHIDLSIFPNLTTIGEDAFRFCPNLTSIDLSGCTSLTTIGDSAFYYCRSLTSITLPSSVTKIGRQAFEGSRITSLTIQGWDNGTWYYTHYYDYISGTEFTGSFADASQNATWFKSDYLYYNYYWYKVS